MFTESKLDALTTDNELNFLLHSDQEDKQVNDTAANYMNGNQEIQWKLTINCLILSVQ